MYEYNAKVEKVLDGDTVDLTIDLGFKVLYQHSCRLYGINAAEHGTEAGDAATAFLKGLLPVGQAVVVQTFKDKTEKYGRVLAVVVLPPLKAKKGAVEGPLVTVNEQLVAAGHAKVWDGKGARPV